MRTTLFSIAAALLLVACGGDVQQTGSGGAGPSGSGSSGQGGSGSQSGSTGQGGSTSQGSSSGQGGASAISPECVVDDDCMIVDDCCTCAGLPKGTTAPDCPAQECFAAACESLGLPNPPPVCAAGRCVAGFDCNQADALCNSPPPSCPPGQTPSVANKCWGGCVDPTECSLVSSCAQCGPGQACVSRVGEVLEGYHCVDVPAACGGVIDCDCVGKTTCVKPYGFCAEKSATELTCECPNC